MANSKSNIYPIQLQGAELCLNRYDAEIKQYRGFNKNNSPFVGGCLSNVFTKEEQISGGNADNVYINSNGDVYRVDAEGFYKNENKLISYNENVKFYQKRKLNKPANSVKIINENVYISEEWTEYTETTWEGQGSVTTFEGYAFVAHWGNGYSKVLCSSLANTITFNIYPDITYKNGCIVFTVKRSRNISGYGERALSYVIIVPDENAEGYYEWRPGYDNKFYLNNIASSLKPQTVSFDENYIYYAENVVMPNNGLGSRVYVFQNNDGVISLLNAFTTFDGAAYSGYQVPSYNFCDWFMCEDGIFHFSNSVNVTFGTGNFFAIAFRAVVRYVNGSMSVSGGAKYDYVFPKYVENKTLKMSCFPVSMTKNYAFYNLVFTDTSDSTKGFVFAFSNDYQNLAYSISDTPGGGYKWVTGATAFVKEGFKILFNNGYISNISIASFIKADGGLFVGKNGQNKSFHGAIIEDWNIIKDVNFYDGKCVYTTYNDELFIVEPTNQPKIKLNNNQLVINCNDEENCYSLDSNEILHFASDWNCSYLDIGLGYPVYQYYGTFQTENTYFIGSAINEYDRPKNSSLIINMQAVTYPLSGGSTLTAPVLMTGKNINGIPSLFIENYMKDSLINFYVGTLESNNATYLISSNARANEKSAGNPFPNNTDGNVPYNPNIFSIFLSNFGTDVFVRNDKNTYQLMKEGQQNIMSYFLGTLIEGLELVFILQGQYYGIMNNKLFGLQFNNGVVADTFFIVNIQGLQFVGNTPYEALFFSKTNRCLYSFTGANVLNQKQLVDKISEVRNYLYNPATQTVFLITDIGVLFYGLFGMFLLEYTNISNIFLLDNGIVMSDNSGNYRYIKYYLDEGDTDYTKENINVETSFYGMNNEVVTINDCLYFRIFSEEHEEGDLKVSATTISLSGRKTEETTFKIKASDWDKITHTIYLRYQPKTQRGLGVAFAIDSPFKIASLSVGSQPDAVLVDKVSKGAITAPSVTTNNNEW